MYCPIQTSFGKLYRVMKEALKKHMISFLTEENRIPGSNEVGVKILEGWKAMQLIRHLIEGENTGPKILKKLS